MYNVRDHAQMRLVRVRISTAVQRVCKQATDLPVDDHGEHVFRLRVQHAIVHAVGDRQIPVINISGSLANGQPYVQMWADPSDPLYQLWEDACPFALA